MQGVNPNPINKDKGTASQVTVNPKQKAYEALLSKNGAFYAMYCLNSTITVDVLNSLLDFFITNSEEVNPIAILEKEPSKTIWSAFFQAYKQPGKATDSNTKNPSQSFRNMLSSFPAKSKAVMLALDEAGLKNNWIIPKNNKKVSFSPEDEKEINDLLVKMGVFNSSMELRDRYRVFKALGGRLSSRAKKQ